MLRCVRRCRSWLRMAQTRCMTTDPLLEQLNTCAGEEQVLQLVGQNEANLSVAHLGCAINLLWQFQKEKPLMRTTEKVRDHPQFIALRSFTKNKINLMDDNTLVEILYIMLRFSVVGHDSLIQQLVVEGWKRLDGLNPVALSKFSVCLTKQDLYDSPIMGHIACIVDNKLDDLQDSRILSILMVSISGVISPRLRDRLIEKVESLLDTMDVHHLHRVLQFLQITKYCHKPLLDKCTQKIIQDAGSIKPEMLCFIRSLLRALSFFNYEFLVLANARCTETMDEITEAGIFARCFEFIGPNSGPEICERLEEGALKFLDKMSLLNLVNVLSAMEKMECRNYTLIQKIAKRLPSYLDLCRPNELAIVARAFLTLHFQAPELIAEIQQVLKSKLKNSCIPSDVVKLTKALTKMPSHQVDVEIVSKLEGIVPQCTISSIGILAHAILQWLQSTPASCHNPSSAAYGNLLKTVNCFGIERVQKMDNINVFLDELKPTPVPWLEKVAYGDVINTFDRLLDQITWQNVSHIARFFKITHFFHPRLLNKVASVTTENITKIHYSEIYTILYPFCVLNLEPPQCEEFFDACSQHFLTHLSSSSPRNVVMMAYALAVAGYYPKELVKWIFNIDFLGKLDTMLEIPSRYERKLVRHRLMCLNRAVCLECAEYQVPWFHDQYCQQVQRKVSIINSAQPQIHQMLGEIFGGQNFVKMSVMTPYYYTIDFECILDKNKNPIPYTYQNKRPDLPKVQEGLDKQLTESKSLPPGARRIAVEFLDSKAFCRNSSHILGVYVMKKRHLEMLGYHVVQVSSLEWNSMELSSKDAQKEYLRKRILEDSS